MTAALGATEGQFDATASTVTIHEYLSGVDRLRNARQGRRVEFPALPWGVEWNPTVYPPAPALDAHGEAIRQEFSAVHPSVTST